MRLSIIRHADPDYPNNTITERGHAEAAALARRLAKDGLTRIYSSPLGRALDTARYTVEATGIAPTVLSWTSELALEPITDLDGQPTAPWNVAGELVRGSQAPAGAPDSNPVNPMSPVSPVSPVRPVRPEGFARLPGALGAEELEALGGAGFARTYAGIVDGSDTLLTELGYRRTGSVYRADEPDRPADHEESVAVFCHAGFGVTWLAHLLDLPLAHAWCGFFLAPSSVTTLVMERRSPGLATPRLLWVGDTSHVYADGLAPNRRGLVANAF